MTFTFSYNKFVLTRGSNSDTKVSKISPPTKFDTFDASFSSVET